MLVGDLPQLPGRNSHIVAIRRLEQRREHARFEHAILVENEEKRRVAPRRVRIVAAPEAKILPGALHVDTRKRVLRREHPLDLRRSFGIGAVILDQQPCFNALHLLAKAADKRAQRGKIRAIRDNADVNDFLSSSLRMISGN